MVDGRLASTIAAEMRKETAAERMQRVGHAISTTRKRRMTIVARRVVLVDDDKSVRVALARLFRSAEMEMTAFESAEDFLVSGLLDSAACLIVDVRMPRMRGLELQQICNKKRAALPIIMISAFDDDDAENRALSAGALAFLRKPFDAASLLCLVREAMGRDQNSLDSAKR